MAQREVTVDECVGCADGCHGCGLNHVTKTIYSCDSCGEEDVDLYSTEDGEFCSECLKSWAHELVDNMDVDEICETFDASRLNTD